MANIIFGNYLGVVCFKLENQSFLQKQQPNTLGTHSAEMGAVVEPKIP